MIYEIATSQAAAGRGVGRSLIRWMQRALARRAIAIKLKCTVDNVGGNKFYAKMGFKNCGEEAGKRRALTIWRMELAGFLMHEGEEAK